MRQFWVFVVKEFYHIVRDRRTMLILLGIPVAQILLFGFAITSEGERMCRWRSTTRREMPSPGR